MASEYCSYAYRSVSHALAFVAGLGVFCVLGSQGIAAEDPVVIRGLKHSDSKWPAFESAIKSANLISAPSGPVLSPSWSWDGDNGRSVPVYVVESPSGALSTPAVVPRNCWCIFVNRMAFELWMRAHSTGQGRMSLEAKYLLTFMLLHELGHLSKQTSGAEFTNGALSQLNIDPSLAKANEEKADEFAAGLLRQWGQSAPASTTSLEANWVAIELTKLSWNMQAYRTLDEFGAMETGKPSVFFDQNLTHPNLGWRVLRSNFLIQQSEEAKALLDAFEEARQKGADGHRLYESP